MPAQVFARYVIAAWSGVIWGMIAFVLGVGFVWLLIIAGVSGALTSIAVDAVQRRNP